MVFGVLLLLQLLLLFFLSHQVTKSLSLFLYHLRFNQNIVIFFIACLFLPGTVIHELSHLIIARLLFVETGAISLLPRLQGKTLRMGSVAVAKVDKLRQLLIGLAPFFVGVALLLGIFFFCFPHIHQFSFWQVGLLIYAIFVIANTMFSSKKDTEGAFFFVVLISSVAVLLFFINHGFLFSILFLLSSSISPFYLQMAMYYLCVPILLDIIIIVVLTLCIRFLKNV